LSLEQRFNAFDRLLDGRENTNRPQTHTNAMNVPKHDLGAVGLQDERQVGSPPAQTASAFAINNDPDQSKVYDRAFIGSGSSIAYYLNALGGLDAFQEDGQTSENIVIGEPDPWQVSAHLKSRGSGYINHQRHLIEQWGDEVPEYSINYLERVVFADQNQKAIEEAGIENWKEAGVTTILKSAETGLFEIFGPTFTKYKAKKVIIGMGAGPHMTIDDINARTGGKKERRIEVQPEGASVENLVIDMDKFMREYREPSDNRKTIVIHGPNAGIDPVERAAFLGHEVVWFVSRTLPLFLEGQRLEYAPAIVPQKVENIEIERQPGGKPLKIRYNLIGDRSETLEIEADFYVLALGQNINALGAAGSVIDEALLNELEPIYDINQIYDDKPYATVLGLQTRGTTKTEGLEVIGAAAYALAKDRKIYHAYEAIVQSQENDRAKGAAKSYFAQKLSIIPEMNSQVKHEASNVIVPPQLASVKASMGALHSIMPKYVGDEAQQGDINFSTDNRTVIRVYMAKAYPNIQEKDAQSIIASIIKHRRTGYHPLGYNQQWIDHWLEILAWWNENHQAPEDIKRQRQKDEEEMRKAREALEERYRDEWRSINRKIHRLFEGDRLNNENLKKLKAYLSTLVLNRRELLMGAYRLGWPTWIPYETENITRNGFENVLDRRVEIVLEGLLSPAQGEFVCRMIEEIS
jgi:hypothetical protein